MVPSLGKVRDRKQLKSEIIRYFQSFHWITKLRPQSLPVDEAAKIERAYDLLLKLRLEFERGRYASAAMRVDYLDDVARMTGLPRERVMEEAGAIINDAASVIRRWMASSQGARLAAAKNVAEMTSGEFVAHYAGENKNLCLVETGPGVEKLGGGKKRAVVC